MPPSPALATSIRATAQVFEDPKSQALLAHLKQVAPSDASVLIIGETGTGKELVARHLRVLQEREVVRLGSRKSIPINVRVLAATNVQPEKAINAGNFREDLYYRLSVVTLELSALRERPGDILPLARHFIAAYSHRLGYSGIALHPEAAQKLVGYSWPGNIRELENVIHHTLLICRANLIRAEDLHLSKLRLERQEDTGRAQDESAEALLQRAFHKLFEEESGALHEKVQESLLVTAYRFCHYNQVHTAQLLGLSRNIIRAQLIKAGELVVNKRRPAPGAQLSA